MEKVRLKKLLKTAFSIELCLVLSTEDLSCIRWKYFKIGLGMKWGGMDVLHA